MPFYSKNAVIEKYGQWELRPGDDQQQLADSSLPDLLTHLCKMDESDMDTTSKWLDGVEHVIQEYKTVSSML